MMHVNTWTCKWTIKYRLFLYVKLFHLINFECIFALQNCFLCNKNFCTVLIIIVIVKGPSKNAWNSLVFIMIFLLSSSFISFFLFFSAKTDHADQTVGSADMNHGQ